MADFNIQRCFGIALAQGCSCFMQPRSSYSKAFLGCSCAGLFLLCAALFFILKSVFGLLLRRVVLALCSPVLHIQRFFGVALAWVALALCSPILHIQRRF